MIVACVQFKTGGIDSIREKAYSLIEKALVLKPDLIVLQELFTTVYFPQYRDESYFKLAEEIPGPVTEGIRKIVSGTKAVVVAPLFEKWGPWHYCSAAVVDAGEGTIGTYRKLHIPTVKDLNEDYYFKPGDLGYRTFDTTHGRIGIMLCYDRHFPESARIYGLKDVDILVVGAATPKSARPIWLTEMQAHAFSNAFTLSCANRSGTEDKIEFLGTSFICDHKGSVLARAGEEGDEIITAELNIEEARKSRKGLAFYRDRRPELYAELALDVHRQI